MTTNPLLKIELEIGDIVLTPLKKQAVVVGFVSGRVLLRYIDDSERVSLQPTLLKLLQKGHREDKRSG